MKTIITDPNEILNYDDLQFEDVDVPEWGHTLAGNGDKIPKQVRIRGLTGVERDQFEGSIIEVRGEGRKQTRKVIMSNIRAKLLVLSIVDADCKPIFTQAQVEALGKKSGKVLDRLFDKARELSGMSDEDVEEMAGNSKPDPNGASSLN